MASRDVSIRFNVEGGDAINRELQNVESRNRSITDNLNRSSKEQVDYSRNTLSNIEAQNRALQEQSNITPMQRSGEGLRTTVSPPQEDTSSFDELRNTTNNFVQNLIDLIKDLIDTTQEGAGKELRADKENTRKSIEAEGRLSRREIQENEEGFEALRKSLQTGKLEADEEKDKETRGQDGLRTGVGAANTIIGSKNEAYAIASLLTAIPFIGSALSKFGERALQATEAYQAGMGRNVGLTGGSLGAYTGVGANMAAYGTTMAEFLQERVGVSRARGGAAGSFGATADILKLERGYALDKSQLLGVERLGRSDVAGRTTRETTETLIATLTQSGVINRGDASAVPEYLQILTELGQQQLVLLGEVNTGVNIKTIEQLSRLDESFKNPEVLREVIGVFKGGLSRAASPEIEALQFTAASRALGPDASLLDIERLREDPLSNTKYVEEFLNILKNAAGGNQEQFIQNIRYGLGQGQPLSVRMAEKIAGGFAEGRFEGLTAEEIEASLTTGEVEKAAARQRGVTEYRARAATPTLEFLTTRAENLFAEKGNELVSETVKKIDEYQSADTITGKISVVAGTFKDIVTSNALIKPLAEKAGGFLEERGVYKGIENIKKAETFKGKAKAVAGTVGGFYKSIYKDILPESISSKIFSEKSVDKIGVAAEKMIEAAEKMKKAAGADNIIGKHKRNKDVTNPKNLNN